MSALTSRRIALSLFTAAALALFGLSPASATPAAPKPTEVSAAERASITESFGKLPLYFIENQGQIDNQVSHYLQGRDKSIYFTSQGVTFVLYQGPTAMMDQKYQHLESDAPTLERQPVERHAIERHVVKLDFLNANPDIKPLGHNKTDAIISYFKGKPSDQHTAIPTWLGVTYANLWDGIDLAYDSERNSLKYTFTVQPHADPGLIQLAYRGADSVTLTDAGALTVSTPAGSLYDGSPIAWQDIDGQRITVPVSFTLAADTHTLSFALGDYDQRHPLTLDPAILVYAGYIGGSGDDLGFGIAVDAGGNAYVTGRTNSTAASFPDTGGPDPTSNGDFDAFVAKVNPAGTALLYAGYIGGSGFDVGTSIAVDAGGNAYVTGFTNSTEATFPEAVGPDLTHNGVGDAFVAKVNPTGTALLYAGYIGGSRNDEGRGIAVDAGGNAYVTGRTNSTEATFPVTVGPDLSYNNGQGGSDAFVAKVNPTGTALVYAGYIGGSSFDQGSGIAVDAGGNAYVTGFTHSTEATFPEAFGPDLTHNGVGDAFVAKVNPTGTALLYAGYIGGSDNDGGSGIAVDAGGNAYVTGNTASTEASFPVSRGPDLTYNGGLVDAFVAKVDAAGSALVYAGYIGGNGDDLGSGIAVDAGGNAYVTGRTNSTAASFPVTGGPDITFNGGFDAFVAKVSLFPLGGSVLRYAGYIGGSGNDSGSGIAVDAAGNAYVTGHTDSTEASFPEIGGPDITYNGGLVDAFVAKIEAEPAPPSLLTARAISSSSIVLGWRDSGNETGFRIERKSGSCASTNPFVQIDIVAANVITYTNPSLTANTAHSYQVRAFNTAGDSFYSNCSGALTGRAGTPNSPSNLRANSVSASQVNLTWADNSSDETSFEITRRIGTVAGGPTFIIAANAVSHSDTTALDNTSTNTYRYFIRACNGAGCSPISTFAVVPFSPTTLAASPVSSSQINLRWTDTSANETAFQIHRKTGNCATGAPWSQLANKAVNSTSHSNTGLTSGTTYAYRIRSFTRSIAMPYARGFSLWSTCVSATIP